jgi:glycosyltransferase involved in cell wall biosynthesis
MPATLRIAFATPEYVTEQHFDGGLANYLHRVSRLLADAGHEVHVVTLSPEDESEFEHAGVMVHRIMLGQGWRTLNWLTRYRCLEGKRYVLYFGRFQLHKGVQIFSRALPRFLERHPDAHAVFVGRDMETSLSSSMAAFARTQCGTSASRLIMIDNLPHRQLYPIVAGARLVVLPSLVDNLPNTCLEAMGLGRTVIGTIGASFDELIADGVNGFLVPPNDPAALSEKMISAWSDPRLEEIGAAAKQRMADFAPEKTLGALLTYYSEVMSQ